MILYLFFSIQERERYKEPVRESLKALLALNWTVEHSDVDAPLSNRGSTRRQSKPNLVSHHFHIFLLHICSCNCSSYKKEEIPNKK